MGTSLTVPGNEPQPLRGSEETLRLLVASVKDYAIFMLDPRGHIMTWNAGAERIKGYTAEEIIGQHFSVFYTPTDIARCWPERELEIALRDGRYEEDGLRVRKDGTHFYATVVISAVYDDAGELRGFAKVTRDITERKRAEEALRASEERLRKAYQELEQRVQERTRQLAETNQELEAFCYTVSHDLRAPLRGMQGFAAALEEDYGGTIDETGLEYLQRIRRATRRMEALIHDLLEYSRLSRDELSMQPLALDEVVDDALAQVAAAIEERGARVTVERDLPRVIGSRSVLARVVANLLSNAVKFVERDKAPVVRVHAVVQGGRARLNIDDNGLGVDPQHQERIFRVFERLHGVDRYPGTGIGLAIVRKGMERMGGCAGVESGPHGGSRFWIELPRVKASQ